MSLDVLVYESHVLGLDTRKCRCGRHLVRASADDKQDTEDKHPDFIIIGAAQASPVPPLADSFHSPIAQLVEPTAVNRLVAGSSPARGAIFLTPWWNSRHAAFRVQCRKAYRCESDRGDHIMRWWRNRQTRYLEEVVPRKRFPGSTPGWRTMFGRLAQLAEQLPYKEKVAGSSPASPTTNFAVV